MQKIVLASKSPRRRELLSLLTTDFIVAPCEDEEVVPFGADVHSIPIYLAEHKAQAVARQYPDALVIGADTVVIFNGELIGKPKNEAHSREILGRLSGNAHEVVTGVCVINGGGKELFSCLSRVRFKKLSDSLIYDYSTSGLVLDKAGSYGIQDGYDIVESYEGSLNNVIGLPTELLEKYFK